jgi:cation transport ATPase
LGLRAVIEGEKVRLGSVVLCSVQAPLSSDTASTLWLTQEGAGPVGFRFKDELRPDAVEVARTLWSHGLDLALLSSDSMEAVAPAAALGIDD